MMWLRFLLVILMLFIFHKSNCYKYELNSCDEVWYSGATCYSNYTGYFQCVETSDWKYERVDYKCPEKTKCDCMYGTDCEQANVCIPVKEVAEFYDIGYVNVTIDKYVVHPMGENTEKYQEERRKSSNGLFFRKWTGYWYPKGKFELFVPNKNGFKKYSAQIGDVTVCQVTHVKTTAKLYPKPNFIEYRLKNEKILGNNTIIQEWYTYEEAYDGFGNSQTWTIEYDKQTGLARPIRIFTYESTGTGMGDGADYTSTKHYTLYENPVHGTDESVFSPEKYCDHFAV